MMNKIHIVLYVPYVKTTATLPHVAKFLIQHSEQQNQSKSLKSELYFPLNGIHVFVIILQLKNNG